MLIFKHNIHDKWHKAQFIAKEYTKKMILHFLKVCGYKQFILATFSYFFFFFKVGQLNLFI